MNKIPILFNPSSGKGRALRKKRDLESALQKNNISYELHLTRSKEHLVDLAVEMASSRPVVAAAGGDSTFTIIADAFARKGINTPLGLIGLGSSNDITREFGLADLESACSALKRNNFRSIDLGAVISEGKDISYFIGQANIGLGAYVARKVEALAQKSRLLGRWQTGVGFYSVLSAFRSGQIPFPLSIRAGEQDFQGHFLLAAFSNIRYWATGRLLNPAASTDDGRLDGCFIRACSLPRLVGLFRASGRGRLEEHREVDFHQSGEFTAVSNIPFEVQTDGELIGGFDRPAQFTKIKIQVRKTALRILV